MVLIERIQRINWGLYIVVGLGGVSWTWPE